MGDNFLKRSTEIDLSAESAESSSLENVRCPKRRIWRTRFEGEHPILMFNSEKPKQPSSSSSSSSSSSLRGTQVPETQEEPIVCTEVVPCTQEEEIVCTEVVPCTQEEEMGPCKCTEPKIPSCHLEFAPMSCSGSSRKRSHDSISANSPSMEVRVARALKMLKALGYLSIAKGKTASILYSNLINKGLIVTVEEFLDEEDIEKQVTLVEQDLKFFEDYARILP